MNVPHHEVPSVKNGVEDSGINLSFALDNRCQMGRGTSTELQEPFSDLRPPKIARGEESS